MKTPSFSQQQLALSFCNFLLKSRKKPVFLCVGSDKVVGDMVGLLVGEMIKNRVDAHVFGTLEHAVTEKNLDNVVSEIRLNYGDSPIVVVDGILGKVEEIGQVKYYPFGSKPGGEFNKGKVVGDYSILGVVDTFGIDRMAFLRSVKLKTVVDVAKQIAESIFLAYKFGGILIG